MRPGDRKILWIDGREVELIVTAVSIDHAILNTVIYTLSDSNGKTISTPSVDPEGKQYKVKL